MSEFYVTALVSGSYIKTVCFHYCIDTSGQVKDLNACSCIEDGLKVEIN